MGRASSAKKVARAARASGSARARRSLAWPATIAAVVVLGMLLLVVTVSEDDPVLAGPGIGEHWHAAYGIYSCDAFIPNLEDVVADASGIHTHGDGLVHMHPFSRNYTGADANLGAWGETVGLELTDDSIQAAGIDVENGDDCGDRPGVVQVKVWSSVNDDEGRVLDGDFADYAPQDLELITIAFVPEGEEIPKPPESALASLNAPIDVVPPSSTSSSTTTPTAATVPGGDQGTTTSTTAGQ